MKRRQFLHTAAALGSLSAVSSRVHGQSAPSGRIVFTRLEGDDGKLAIINADGTGMKPLATGQRSSLYPAWSPDGRTIAFTGFESLQTAPSVYVIGADGNNERRLSDANTFSVLPCWSPDGKQLLYSNREGDETRLRLCNLDGTLVRDLDPMSARIAFFAALSPDGKRIAVSKGDRQGAFPSAPVWLLAVDGSSSEQLTTGDGFHIAGAGAWSPDGKLLLTTRATDSPRMATLWVTDLMTRGETSLGMIGSGMMKEPIMPTACWSPDGKWIACAVMDNGKSKLELISRDGQTRKALTPPDEICFAPNWTK